jgi:hypothetical protein
MTRYLYNGNAHCGSQVHRTGVIPAVQMADAEHGGRLTERRRIGQIDNLTPESPQLGP